MKLALYARVASQHPGDRHKVQSQIEMLRHRAIEIGHTVAPGHVYCDVAQIGMSLDRPGLNRLRTAVQTGAFDAVLILSSDRLSRSHVDLDIILDEFQRSSTPIIFAQHFEYVSRS